MDTTARVAREGEPLMRRALDLAREGWGQTAPNPMVGAVVVRDGTVVGEGHHARFGDAHAEVVALRAAGDRARGATLYVTLEPCRHHGKTPPCTDAILAAGIREVVIAASDPTSRAGGGASVLRERGVDVKLGLLEAEARELNAAFFHAERSDLPWVTLKLAVSEDMAIAATRGTTTWLTGLESRVETHRMRAGHDAIGVGVGTVLADDPLLTVREARMPRVPPARVIFDRALRTPLGSGLVRSARETPTVIVTEKAAMARAAAFEQAGVRVMPAADLRDGLRLLRAAGIRSLLIEGGAAMAASVLAGKLAHRLVIFQAPVTLGPEALPAFDGAQTEVLRALKTLPILDRKRLGPDTVTTYALAES
jgi:diaminohydroxyphosphoribosylaminopyrimidine deaminase / 5-amino-6-(5-phosphoribosylamino)uracil reductase